MHAGNVMVRTKEIAWQRSSCC